MNRRRIALVVLLVVASAVCIVVLGVSVEDPSPDPDATRERVAETNQSIDAYEATLVVKTDLGNRTRTTRYRVAVDRPGRQNLTVVSPANRSGNVFLANRSGTFVYDRANGTLTRLGDTPNSPDVLAQFVRALSRGGTDYRGEDRLEGSSGVVLEYSAGGQDVGLRIGGSAPSLRYSARGRTDEVDVSVWVDPDRNLPLRLNQTISLDGRTITTTLELEDLETDPEFEAGRFSLDPAGAEVVDRTNLTRYYDTRAALARNVSLPVPDPSVPANFSFERGTLVRANGSRVVVATYSNGTDRISVQVGRVNVTTPFGENGTEVDVGDATGYYRELGPTRAVGWQCGEFSLSVAGTVGKETVLSVARSVGCRPVE